MTSKTLRNTSKLALYSFIPTTNQRFGMKDKIPCRWGLATLKVTAYLTSFEIQLWPCTSMAGMIF
jgi:hypothetical protein